jgi:hypothetical protein
VPLQIPDPAINDDAVAVDQVIEGYGADPVIPASILSLRAVGGIGPPRVETPGCRDRMLSGVQGRKATSLVGMLAPE